MWNLIRRLFGVTTETGEREIARVRGGVLYRPPMRRRALGGRSAREVFLEAAAIALEVPTSDLSLDVSMVEEYGVDELQVLECVQAAEDVWGVRLLPETVSTQDLGGLLGRFKTLAALVAVAESPPRAG